MLQSRMSVVFQDYTTSANPRFRVRDILMEGISAWERKSGERLERCKESERLLNQVGLSGDFADRFPHELSGGQLQRVSISSLDAHTQVQIMDLLTELKKLLVLTYIFITHELTSVTYFCDQVLFLYQGTGVEHIAVSRIREAKHPYAVQLLSSVIELEGDKS